MSSPNALAASTKVLDVLKRLHAASSAQEGSFSLLSFWIRKSISTWFGGGRTWSSKDDDFMRDKFISLEADKCEFMYLLARSTGALNIVEAGTSFGVSTIYLALAVGQNAAAKASGDSFVPGQGGTVLATENEPGKAKKAKEHWKEAGNEVEPWINLLEGDLRETLPEAVGKLDQIDLLLLDIWTPMALPALQAVQPKLRHGALIIADNTATARLAYKELFAYINDPKNGFRYMTTPFKGGLENLGYNIKSLLHFWLESKCPIESDHCNV
ncbi:hypothetical protein FQN57_001970 [Myotisia sp. PD_48]|nr:hypothetical protein FQN57_001970 [Myotisia sp. PD_48]